MPYLFASALVLLSLAQVGIVDWAMRLGAWVPADSSLARTAGAEGGLAPLHWVWVTVAFTTLNFLLFPMARRRIHSSGWNLLLGRGWLLWSIGALASGVLLILAHGLVRGAEIALMASDSPGQLVDSALVAAGGAALALGFGSVGWAYAVGQRGIRVEHLTLPLPGLAPALERLRIVHVTDLHIGPLMRAPQLRGYVERINALEPDLVVLTGDLFDFDPAYIDEGCRALAGLRATHGVFAVLGNHDVYVGAEKVAEGLARLSGVRLLRNEWARIEEQGAAFCLAGFEDPGRGWRDKHARSPELARLAESLPPELPWLLLVHRPSFFRQAAGLGFKLSLAGHTHGGQISLPFAPEHNFARLISPWTRGMVSEEGAVLYVNRGLGVAGLPLRLNCPREVALIRLSGG